MNYVFRGCKYVCKLAGKSGIQEAKVNAHDAHPLIPACDEIARIERCGAQAGMVWVEQHHMVRSVQPRIGHHLINVRLTDAALFIVDVTGYALPFCVDHHDGPLPIFDAYIGFGLKAFLTILTLFDEAVEKSALGMDCEICACKRALHEGSDVGLK